MQSCLHKNRVNRSIWPFFKLLFKQDSFFEHVTRNDACQNVLADLIVKKNAMNGRVMIVFEAGCPSLDSVCNNYSIITQHDRCYFTYTPLLHLYYAQIHVLHYHYFMSPISSVDAAAHNKAYLCATFHVNYHRNHL